MKTRNASKQSFRDFQVKRLHSARKSRSGLEASFFMIFLISALSKSSAVPLVSSNIDSGRMR